MGNVTMITDQSLQVHRDLSEHLTNRIIELVGPILSIAEPGSMSVLAVQGAATLVYLVPPTMGSAMLNPETVASVKARVMARISEAFDQSVTECIEGLSKAEAQQ